MLYHSMRCLQCTARPPVQCRCYLWPWQLLSVACKLCCASAAMLLKSHCLSWPTGLSPIFVNCESTFEWMGTRQGAPAQHPGAAQACGAQLSGSVPAHGWLCGHGLHNSGKLRLHRVVPSCLPASFKSGTNPSSHRLSIRILWKPAANAMQHAYPAPASLSSRCVASGCKSVRGRSALQFVREFAKLGLTRSVGGVLGLALARELTPVVTSIILAGTPKHCCPSRLSTACQVASAHV